MIKSVAVFLRGFVEHFFSLMSERAVTEVVSERNGFYEVGIEFECAAYGAGYSRH